MRSTAYVVNTVQFPTKAVFYLRVSGATQGMYFGCLPFELFRVLASVALGVFFMSTMWRHRATLLPVHHMILGVIVLGTFEALAWLTAYTYMNRTGE